MKVELKEMHLRNFKGVADGIFQFSHNTIVRGTNGTGKTTLNDAFTYCLYGKDSKGRADFGFKRRGSDCNVIHEMEYSVEVTLVIDGKEKRFERTMVEKWTKPRGFKEKVLSGHEFLYYIDRVRCATKKEYDAEVNAIMREDIMRMMTDPAYFVGEKDDVKKAVLLRMAFGTSNEDEANKLISAEVLASHTEFTDFVDYLDGTNVEKYNREVALKIKAIKEEIDQIPIKISAKKEATPAEDDWDAIEGLIEAQKEELAKIDKQIADVNARYAGATEMANKLRAQISNAQVELITAENELRVRVNNDNMSKLNAINSMNAEFRSLQDEYHRKEATLKEDNAEMERLTITLDNMRNQFRTIKAGTYQFSEAEMMCPTCHRPYDIENLVASKLEENKMQGLKVRAEYDRYNQEVVLLNQRLAEITAKMATLSEQIKVANYQPMDVNEMLDNDTKCCQIRQKIEGIKSQLAQAPQVMDTSSLSMIKREAQAKIDEFNSKLGTRNVIAQIERQVEQLEQRQKALNNELAQLEKMQDTAKLYMKAKDEVLLAKVNGLFEIVSWKFVSEQLNGGERLCCNCFVDGMPYAEKNRAGQINGGLDIINAICRSEGVNIPIFVDNAESVVEYIHTDSQKVLLMVDGTCSQLTIESI